MSQCARQLLSTLRGITAGGNERVSTRWYCGNRTIKDWAKFNEDNRAIIIVIINKNNKIIKAPKVGKNPRAKIRSSGQNDDPKRFLKSLSSLGVADGEVAGEDLTPRAQRNVRSITMRIVNGTIGQHSTQNATKIS